MMVKSYGYLYAYRTDGKIQRWHMEQDGDQYRTVSGIMDGDSISESSVVTSAWKKAEPTNVGRSNERNGIEQAEFEILALYKKKREDKYSEVPTKDRGGQIKPMLADKYTDKTVISGTVYSQPKLDGIRAIVTRDGIFSRTWKPIVSVPHIHEALMPYLEGGIVFDGELYNHNLSDNFNKIISLTRKTVPTKMDLEESKELIEYWAFDLIDPNLTFSKRWEMLSSFKSEFLVHTPTNKVDSQSSLDELMNSYMAVGYEGQMVRFDSLYENKRSKSLLKRKNFIDEEFTIEDILEGTGNWAGYAKMIVFSMPNGTKTPSGDLPRATLKNNQDFCRDVLLNKDKYIGGKVTVRYQNLSEYGIPRFPIAVAVYEGNREL